MKKLFLLFLTLGVPTLYANTVTIINSAYDPIELRFKCAQKAETKKVEAGTTKNFKLSCAPNKVELYVTQALYAEMPINKKGKFTLEIEEAPPHAADYGEPPYSMTLR